MLRDQSRGFEDVETERLFVPQAAEEDELFWGNSSGCFYPRSNQLEGQKVQSAGIRTFDKQNVSLWLSYAMSKWTRTKSFSRSRNLTCNDHEIETSTRGGTCHNQAVFCSVVQKFIPSTACAIRIVLFSYVMCTRTWSKMETKGQKTTLRGQQQSPLDCLLAAACIFLAAHHKGKVQPYRMQHVFVLRRNAQIWKKFRTNSSSLFMFRSYLSFFPKN